MSQQKALSLASAGSEKVSFSSTFSLPIYEFIWGGGRRKNYVNNLVCEISQLLAIKLAQMLLFFNFGREKSFMGLELLVGDSSGKGVMSYFSSFKSGSFYPTL